MRLKQVTIAGFRGFNAPCTLVFDERLTLLSAANSYGKTSITEALEFLLYGRTSKVDAATSKEEYKGSYLNRHYPAGTAAYVEAVCTNPGVSDTTLRVETDGDTVWRFVDGQAVAAWPFTSATETAAPPFVVQHALKALLLSGPADRFTGFARILGLQDVDAIQQVFVNLCTKPDAHVPRRARELVASVDTFESRLKAIGGGIPKAAKEFAKGPAGLPKAYQLLHARAETLLARRVDGGGVHDALVALRNAAALKIFAGSVAIHSLDSTEAVKLAADGSLVSGVLHEEFRSAYLRLLEGDQSDRQRRLLRFLDLGISLLPESAESCPFCEQPLAVEFDEHVKERHADLVATLGTLPDSDAERVRLQTVLNNVERAIAAHGTLLGRRCDALIAAATPEQSQQLKALIAKGNEDALFLVAAGGAAAGAARIRLREAQAAAIGAVQVAATSLRTKTQSSAHLDAMDAAIKAYLLAAEAYTRTLDETAPTLAEPSRLLREAVDAQAGTAELSLLIELFHDRADVVRGVKIRDVLAGLRDLRKHVDQAVGETMEAAFANVLTDDVMEWYQRIRTIGDPDVHFSGFSMEKTAQGAFKNRRVKVEARSYGVALASAVSSLSESKLNALGLCISIATSLRYPGPWTFLVLDDPIQSWDDDHEIQFIEITRAIAQDMGKQIILLSHRGKWVETVAANLRSLNGTRYEITGYTKEGPVIVSADWATIDQRLDEIRAIANDASADRIRLQHAEEEVRLAACQLAADVSTRLLKRQVRGHSLNGAKLRTILVEAGCPLPLTDRVSGTFKTSDEAHHVGENYAAAAQRIRQYHGALVELRNWLRDGERKAS